MEQKALGIDAGQSGASQTHFRQFVQEVLAYMTSVARLCGQQSTKPAQARFWRALSSKVYDILDKVCCVCALFVAFPENRLADAFQTTLCVLTCD